MTVVCVLSRFPDGQFIIMIIIKLLNVRPVLSKVTVPPLFIFIIVACGRTPSCFTIVHRCARVIPVVVVNEGKYTAVSCCGFRWTTNPCDKSTFCILKLYPSS